MDNQSRHHSGPTPVNPPQGVLVPKPVKTEFDYSTTSPTTPVVIKRRASIACRRCRRMRSKCVHVGGEPPCKSCQEAGLSASDCVFPVRGQPDNDRDYRHPRVKGERTKRKTKSRRESTSPPGLKRFKSESIDIKRHPPSLIEDEWSLLPEIDLIIEAINNFTRHYFQLGFIPRQQFCAQLKYDPQSMSPFLLLSILSISARFTPSLSGYGDGAEASRVFMERAAHLARQKSHDIPSLEACQAFYLLSIAQQGEGQRSKSYMNLGLAIRMATLMRLHKEETYILPSPSPGAIMRAESARRTLWMLHSQDNLHSGFDSPVSLSASDITAKLPCDEDDFAAGRIPEYRSVLDGSPPNDETCGATFYKGRSLFASLIQIHHYWGQIARRAMSRKHWGSEPWRPDSDFAIMAQKLRTWEQHLPADQTWSRQLLKQHKAKNQDLGYLGVTMMTRLCNIVLRRTYLHDMIRSATQDPGRRTDYSVMADELFSGVDILFEQIDAQFTDRDAGESVGAQMATFCVYSCGLFAMYLVKHPIVCPNPLIRSKGQMMVHRTMSILEECKEVWALAKTWLDKLVKFYRDPKGAPQEGSMADGRDPLPQALPGPSTLFRSIPSPSLSRLGYPEDTKRNFPTPTVTPTSGMPPILPPPSHSIPDLTPVPAPFPMNPLSPVAPVPRHAHALPFTDEDFSVRLNPIPEVVSAVPPLPMTSPSSYHAQYDPYGSPAMTPFDPDTDNYFKDLEQYFGEDPLKYSPSTLYDFTYDVNCCPTSLIP